MDEVQWSTAVVRGMWDKDKASALDDKKWRKYDSLPKVELSAYDEIGRKETSIPVLKQQAYTGRILPSAIADTPCANLGVEGIMLEMLGVPSLAPDSSLYKACEAFITENWDFGTAYAHLRPHLYYDFVTDRRVDDVIEAMINDNNTRQDMLVNKQISDDVMEALTNDDKRRDMLVKKQVFDDAMEAMNNDAKMRRDMLVNKQIFDGDAPPRRVWDLVANRVVPWWVARKYPWGISHAWLNDNDLKGEMTPINGYEWPVPMPKDADLNLIRIEMLNLGAEYIWLDVLCLRQKGQGEDPRGNPSQEEWERKEVLRQEEWKVDLPTIGWIYHKAEKVVCYFSGLGLPLSFKSGDFESDRCWFNRAWTLQETRRDLLIVGETGHDGGFIANKKGMLNWFNRLWKPQKTTEDRAVSRKTCKDSRFMPKEMQKLFDKKLRSLRQMRREDSVSMLDVLSQMQKRKSTKPVDKVAGLVYLFYSQYIPIYDADQSEEDAWTELVNITQDWFRGEFFFYPGPGNGRKFWHPSWKQVMTETLSGLIPWDRQSVIVYRTEEGGDRYNGPRIDSCRVWGLSDESTAEMPRRGKLDAADGSGKKHTVKIVANHAFPIPDDLYTLIGIRSPPYFSVGVIGKIEGPEKKFRKVSVIKMGHRAAATINVMGIRAETYLL